MSGTTKAVFKVGRTPAFKAGRCLEPEAVPVYTCSRSRVNIKTSLDLQTRGGGSYSERNPHQLSTPVKRGVMSRDRIKHVCVSRWWEAEDLSRSAGVCGHTTESEHLH